jgi:hypothetical protein
VLPPQLVIAVAVQVALAPLPGLVSPPSEATARAAHLLALGGRRRRLESPSALRAPPPRNHAASVAAGARRAEFQAPGVDQQSAAIGTGYATSWITKAPQGGSAQGRRQRQSHSRIDESRNQSAAQLEADSTETRSDDAIERVGSPWRIDWHTLLHRVYDVDSLACPCGGRLRFTELVVSLRQACVTAAALGR